MSDINVINISAGDELVSVKVRRHHGRPAVALAIYFLEGNKIMSTGVIRIDQSSLTAHLAPLDAAGDAGAALPKDASGNQIVPKWTMGDTSLCSMTPAADGLSAVFDKPVKAGSAAIDVVADLSAAQDGSNIQHGVGTLNVIPGAAVSFALSFDNAQ